MTDKNVLENNKKIRLTGIALLYFLGVLTGVVIYIFPINGYSEYFCAVTENFILCRLSKDFTEIMISSFCEPFILLLVCFLLGLSAIAHPVEYLVIVFHGLGIGVTLAEIYDNFNADEIVIAILMIIPGTVITAFAVIIAVREALNMSSDICSASFGRNGTGVKIDFRLYFTKFVILCAMIVAGALVESLFIFFLADLWCFKK